MHVLSFAVETHVGNRFAADQESPVAIVHNLVCWVPHTCLNVPPRPRTPLFIKEHARTSPRSEKVDFRKRNTPEGNMTGWF